MKNVTIGATADGATIGFDLEVLLRTRLLVQANSGGGKSWLLRRLAEQLFGRVPVFIIDPDGDFSTLREKFGFVLAGKGGETPADCRSAALLAEKLLELNASAICDLYELKPHERHKWVRLFLESLMNAPKDRWHPLVVIVDEAHLWCPEKGAGESEASGAMIDLATRGRRRGFCAVWATQRLGKLRKDAAAELTNVMVGKTFIDVDRDRAADALGVSRSDRAQFDATVRNLAPGAFFCLGAAVSNERALVRVGEVQTRHPEAGSAIAAAPPPTPEKVKALLPKLGDLPKQAEERAHTEAELRAEIRSLRGMLAARERAGADAGPQALERAAAAAVAQAQREWASTDKALRREIGRMHGQLAAIAKIVGAAAPTLPATPAAPAIGANGSERLASRVAPAPLARRSARSEGDGRKLRAGAERMLAALCRWSPNGMMEGQMRAQAGMKKSGTFSAYMSDLRGGGYIEERDGLIFASPAGLDYFGEVPAAPQSTDEVLEIWRPKLRDGARRMLDALVTAGGRPMGREELAEAAGLTNSGTFSAYLSDLRTARLAVVGRDGVAADRESLFL